MTEKEKEDMKNETRKRMEELCSDNLVMEKVTWAASKLGKKSKVKKCVCCSNRANGMGMFLLHKSKNSLFNLEEGRERLYLYFACDDHVLDDNGLKEVESVLKSGSNKNYIYVDIN